MSVSAAREIGIHFDSDSAFGFVFAFIAFAPFAFELIVTLALIPFLASSSITETGSFSDRQDFVKLVRIPNPKKPPNDLQLLRLFFECAFEFNPLSI